MVKMIYVIYVYNVSALHNVHMYATRSSDSAGPL